ncbi:hypothetical protein HDU97_003574 [Phlyctochytrium planicorne]|nr:hypothetical protein HDU97_003574 [Phlyctochytrium planicorne]
MFLLKSIGSIVWGKQDDSLFQIPEGQLFHLNPPGAKIAKALVFKNASATIKRSTIPHNYQLLITRIFDEGEEDDDVEAETEYTFLIDEVLRFRRIGSGSKKGFFWADPLDDTKSTGFEFIASPSTTDASFATFEHVTYQSMFERRSGKDHASATDEELEAYINFAKASANAFKLGAAGGGAGSASRKSAPIDSPLARTPESTKNRAPPKSVESTPSTFDPMSTTTTPHPGQASTPGGMARIPSQILPPGKEIVTCEGELYLFDSQHGQFIKMQDLVTATIIETGSYDYKLVLLVNSEVFLVQTLESEMQGQFNGESKAFVWLYKESEELCYPWSLKFFDRDSEVMFRDAFGRCMYEANNHENFLKVKEDDRSYLLNAYEEDVEMEDAREAAEEPEEEEEEEEEENEGENGRVIPENNAKISQLCIGHKDRSFFVRGKSIGVVKHLSDDSIEYAASIDNVSTLGKDFFVPKNLMLQDQDSSLLMMKPNEEHTIFKMDLNVGKVVEEWKVDDVMTVDSIIPDFKSAAMTPNKTIVGINHNAIFRIDPRQSGNKLVQEESKQYVTKNKFSCATTTGKGELAVASEKGEIRLYNKLNMRAKTHLPGLGDPILGIDTTENGKWIVATCKNYLLLISTEGKDAKDQAISAFSKSFGDKKPAPRRLQLKPEHVAFMGTPISFTPARFNTGEGEEKSIVTSSGPYVITWNFRRVKQGKLFDYTIKKYNENVVADNFKFGQDKNIIVALPSDVQSVTKSKLQTPAKMLKSRSSIVNSPY